MSDTTPWGRVFLLFLAGVVVAFLIGKAPVALPLLRADLGLSILQAGMVVSLFSIVAAGGAAMFGAFSDRFGHRKVALLGLLLAAASSVAGAFTPNANLLLLTRAGEGVGFFMVTVSIPPLMLSHSAEKDRQKAMGLWGAFLPAGAAVIMLAGGAMGDGYGWRGIWIITAICLVAAALVLSRTVNPASSQTSAHHSHSPLAAYAILRYLGPVILAAIFCTYSAQFLAVTAFIPLLLVEQADWSVAAAGTAGAVILGVNIIGNLASGVLLDRGWSRRAVILIGAAAMAFGAIGVLSTAPPVLGRLGAGVLFSAVSGVIPGALFAGVPRHAPTPGQTSTLSGLLLQGAAIGQLIGPMTAAWFAGGSGSWSNVLWFTLPAAGATVVLAIILGRLERNH